MTPRRLLLIALFLWTAFIARAADLPTFLAPEEVSKIRVMAEAGDAKAQAYLGKMYAEGCGVLPDEATALRWFLRAAEGGHLESQFYMGICYSTGAGTPADLPEAVHWWKIAAERGHMKAQHMLSLAYGSGHGTEKDPKLAVRWALKAAEQGHAGAQSNIALHYAAGFGVPMDKEKSLSWFRKAALQGNSLGQLNVGLAYALGKVVKRDDVEATMWLLLAAAQGEKDAKKMLNLIDEVIPAKKRAEARRRAENFVARPNPLPPAEKPPIELAGVARPRGSGSGFFITKNGYFITNEHVAEPGAKVRLRVGEQEFPATVVTTDHANDLALLKVEGTFTPLPIIPSREIRLGATVATVGFPNVLMQGVLPKFSKGEIASLAGPSDSPREFQMSAPIQPGNSGGPLVDERGNVVGVVVAQLNKQKAIKSAGFIPENVNYAIKSSYLLSFLESVPEVTALLRSAHTAERKFDDVVQDTLKAAALVLVY